MPHIPQPTQFAPSSGTAEASAARPRQDKPVSKRKKLTMVPKLSIFNHDVDVKKVYKQLFGKDMTTNAYGVVSNPARR